MAPTEKSLLEQALAAMDEALDAEGGARHMLLDRALELYRRAREADGADYPPNPDQIEPAASAGADHAGDEGVEPPA